MTKPLFTGVCTALVTPFGPDGVDLVTLRRLIERQLEAGVRALVIAGTTGESATLTHQEKLTLFEAAVRIADGRCCVIGGTGSNNTAASVTLTREAASTGLDGVLCVTPYYNKCTQAGLRLHYEAIADAGALPVILYNVPSRTGVQLSPETCAALSQHPQVAGLKEADPDAARLLRLHALCGPDFPIYCGCDERIVPFYAAGACGVISVWSNVRPADAVHLCDLCQSGDYRAAAALQRCALPLIDALFHEVNPIPVKAALRLQGIDCGSCRLPLTDASAPLLNELRRLVEET